MDKNQLDALREPLEVRTRQGGRGVMYEYVASSDVIDRLNEVFEGNWSSKVENITKDEATVVVEVSLTAGSVTHAGFGGHKLEGEAGTAYKAAKAKAIKDAAKSFGIRVHDEESGGDSGYSSNTRTPSSPNKPTAPQYKSNKPITPPVGASASVSTPQEVTGSMPDNPTKVSVPVMPPQRKVSTGPTAPVGAKPPKISGFQPATSNTAPPVDEVDFMPPKSEFMGVVHGEPQEVNILPNIPQETVSSPPKINVPGSRVNEVQKSAINNALRTKKITYDELWTEAVVELGLDPANTEKDLDRLDRTVASKMVANSHTKDYKD